MDTIYVNIDYLDGMLTGKLTLAKYRKYAKPGSKKAADWMSAMLVMYTPVLPFLHELDKKLKW
jgi:hypothetical protein